MHYGFKFKTDGSGDNNFHLLRHSNSTTGNKALSVGRDTGDISFYEDTGTTPKLFWDASAESLGIGTTSPKNPLYIDKHISYPNNTNNSADAWNAEGKAHLFLESHNNALAFGVDDTVNARTAWIQVGHRDNTYASQTDNELLLQPFGGNVGIGTSSPSAKVEIYDTQNTQLRVNTASHGYLDLSNYSNGAGVMTSASHPLRLGTANTERMRIDSSGNLLVSKTSAENITAGHRFETNGFVSHVRSGNEVMILNRLASDGSVLTFRKDGTTVGSINSYAGARLGIGSNGVAGAVFGQNAVIPATGGTTLADNAYDLGTSSYRWKDLYLSGTANVEKVRAIRTNGVCGEFDRSNNGHAVQFFHNSALVGSISVTGTATAYNTSSDQRLKENIQDSEDAGSKIDAIKVRQFDWKADGSHQDYGVIAQELLEVAPEAVTAGETKDDMMSVDYSKLVPTLIKEIQTLRNRVAQLENN